MLVLTGCPHSAHQPTHSFLGQRVDLLPIAQALGPSLNHLRGSPGLVPRGRFPGAPPTQTSTSKLDKELSRTVVPEARALGMCHPEQFWSQARG